MKITLRDKFLISFLGLAIVLTGMLLMLAQRVYDLLPSISSSQTARYEAQLLLRDIRETVLDAELPDNPKTLISTVDPVKQAIDTYQNTLSLSASRDTYQALVVEDGRNLIQNEERIVAGLSTALRTFKTLSAEGRFTEARIAMQEVIDRTYELEQINKDAAAVLLNAQKTTQRYTITFFLISIAILLLGITIFAQLLGVWITHPLRKIQTAAMLIADGDFSHELKADSHDELGSLMESFDYMRRKVLKSLEEVYAFAKRDEILIDSIIDSIIAVDQDGRVILFNAAAERITGWSRLGVIHKPLDSIVTFDADDKKLNPIQMVQDVIKTGQARSFLKPIYMAGTKNNRQVPVTLSVAPFIEETGGKGAVMVFKDVSDVQELDRLREEFVSIASHQLRTPLTAIRWLLETLLKGVQEHRIPLETKQQATLEQAYSRTLSMSDLVSSLLALSRLDAQKIKASLGPVDIKALFAKLDAAFQAEAQRKQITIEKNCSIEKPVMSDEIILTEVLTNLISNAIKYTKPGGKVTMEALADAHALSITVSDNGIGIPVEQQKSMFKKFFRAKNALSFTPEGTGIGLYMVKSFLELIGGTISFESKENTGTRFTVTLPI